MSRALVGREPISLLAALAPAIFIVHFPEEGHRLALAYCMRGA